MANGIKTLHHAHWYDGLYRADIHLLIGGDDEEAREYLRRVTKAKVPQQDTSTMGGWTYQYRLNGCLGVVVWLSDWRFEPKDYSDLSHELLHVTNIVLLGVGIPWGNFKEDDNEAQAYYLGYLMKRATLEISRMGIKA
jgi:hypothetical protein